MDIIASILYVALTGKPKTRIMNKAMLNYKQTEEYLLSLLKSGLLQKDVTGKRTIFKTTGKGAEFILRYEGLKELIED